MNNDMMSFFMNVMKSGGNPEAAIMQMLKGQNSPIAQNLLGLAQRGDAAGMEQIARNLCQQRGMDFDREFKTFKEQLGFK